MDHAQARAFHHHLARALMHLNYLAGLLPFFEPSIEWEDSLPPQNLRLENMRSRSLHTFVPLPPSSAPPTLVTHGGIPSHMVENPEPNLRPTTFRPPTHMEREHPSINSCSVLTAQFLCRILIRIQKIRRVFHLDVKSPGTRFRFQFAPSKGSPPPLTHNQRSDKKYPTLRIPQYPGNMTLQLPLHFRFPQTLLSMHSILMTLMVMAHQQRPPFTTLTLILLIVMSLPLTLPFLLVTSAITLTPNPKAPASPPSRNLPPTPMDPPRAPPFRPWTNADDQELMSMKQDTKSRPSWKSIGARLHRDPQVCKLRWGILKQTLGTFDQPGRVNPTLDHEADD